MILPKFQQGFAIALALPWLGSLITSAMSFVFRKVVITFIVVTAIYVLIEFLTPLLLRLAGHWFNFSIPNLLQNFSPAMWWFMSAFQIDFGMKIITSAYATRFLIRRIPFIG